MYPKQTGLKKALLIFWFGFIAVSFSSCIDENMKGCPPYMNENLILRFHYTDAKENDIFSKNIHKVDVFVFNYENRLVMKQTKDQQALNDFQGTKLHLPAGKYRVVCWGNAFDHTAYSGIDIGLPFNKALLTNASVNKESITTNGDPLHYAPARQSNKSEFIVTVPETGIETAIFAFNSAHIRIEVYVKGVQDISPEGLLLDPIVELTDIPAGYDFDRNTFGAFISYRNTSTTIFHTPLFSTETPTRVLIKKASNKKIIANISLSDFIKDNKIEISETKQTVIPLLVEFTQTSIIVSIPEWIQKPTKPEL